MCEPYYPKSLANAEENAVEESLINRLEEITENETLIITNNDSNDEEELTMFNVENQNDNSM